MTIRPVQTTPMTFDEKSEKRVFLGRLVPYNDQNASSNDRADEDKPFSFAATKGGITDIQELTFHQPSTFRGPTGHFPEKVRQTGIPSYGITQTASTHLRPGTMK